MKKYISTVLISFLFFSCEMVIDVDVPRHPDKLVVNCLFSADSSWNFQILKSHYILDEPTPTIITNALIKVFENDNLVDEIRFHDNQTQYYSANHQPKADKKYRIEVTAPGFETVYAEDVMEKKPIINSVQYTQIDIIRDYSTVDEIEFSFNDQVGENYYELSVSGMQYYSYTDFEGNTFSDSVYTEIPITSDNIYFDQDDYTAGKLYFVDFLGDGIEYKIKFLIFKYQDYEGSSTTNKNLQLKLKSISKSYYLYQRSINNHYQNGDNPFSEPVMVHTNIKNGYGIFAGYNLSAFPIPQK